MSNPITPIIGLICTLIGLLAPLYMMLLVWLIRWDEQPTPADDPWDVSVTVRGDLPRWLRWAQTMDQRYPGGLYEPAMMAALGNGGYWRRLWTSYLWTGHRNRAMGLAYLCGKPAIDYIPDPWSTDRDTTGWVQDGNVWRFDRPSDAVWKNIRVIGSFQIHTGHQVYRLADGSFHAVPLFTIRAKKLPEHP